MKIIVSIPQHCCKDSMGMCTRFLAQSPGKSKYSPGIFPLPLPGELLGCFNKYWPTWFHFPCVLLPSKLKRKKKFPKYKVDNNTIMNQ